MIVYSKVKNKSQYVMNNTTMFDDMIIRSLAMIVREWSWSMKTIASSWLFMNNHSQTTNYYEYLYENKLIQLL